MPQMSPLNWLLLFMIFILMFLLQMILNYFIFQPLKKSTFSSSKKSNSLIWKW